MGSNLLIQGCSSRVSVDKILSLDDLDYDSATDILSLEGIPYTGNIKDEDLCYDVYTNYEIKETTGQLPSVKCIAPPQHGHTSVALGTARRTMRRLRSSPISSRVTNSSFTLSCMLSLQEKT